MGSTFKSGHMCLGFLGGRADRGLDFRGLKPPAFCPVWGQRGKGRKPIKSAHLQGLPNLRETTGSGPPFSPLPTLERRQPRAPASGTPCEALPHQNPSPLAIAGAGGNLGQVQLESWGRSAASGLQWNNTNREKHSPLSSAQHPQACIFPWLQALLLRVLPHRPPPSPPTCSPMMPETASHGHGNEGPEDRLAATEQGARGTLGVDQAEGSSGDYI